MKRNKVYITRLTKLADWLEAGAPHTHVKFNMGVWLALTDAQGRYTHDPKTACGSVCCISGAAVQFFAPEVAKRSIEPGPDINMNTAGAEALGLNYNEARDLFYGADLDLEKITPRQAGAVVRHLIETGIVDWNAAKRVRA